MSQLTYSILLSVRNFSAFSHHQHQSAEYKITTGTGYGGASAWGLGESPAQEMLRTEKQISNVIKSFFTQ
jgi:hypothetical protein